MNGNIYPNFFRWFIVLVFCYVWEVSYLAQIHLFVKSNYQFMYLNVVALFFWEMQCIVWDSYPIYIYVWQEGKKL